MNQLSPSAKDRALAFLFRHQKLLSLGVSTNPTLAHDLEKEILDAEKAGELAALEKALVMAQAAGCSGVSCVRQLGFIDKPHSSYCPLGIANLIREELERKEKGLSP